MYHIFLTPRLCHSAGENRMDYQINGKCAFVNAGAHGIGEAIAPRVRVNAVLPGPIWTHMWTRPGGIVDQLVSHYGTDKGTALDRFLAERYMPLGIGKPADVARAVVFLASPLAKFITGTNLDIGGTLRGLV
jgi:NAD(P)-dependent dehydrogenase (short-subunit alcohol dehydrogenase family)